SIYWSSSNTAAATVDQTGLATGTGIGTTTITATCSTVQSAVGAALTVVSPTNYMPWQAPSLLSTIPIPPQATVDTTYNLPTGGTTYTPPDAATLTTDLGLVQPGDVIVLTAGTTYSGSFKIPALSNPSNKWLYIISSDLASLPVGTRVQPTDASHMA